jgi:hypothetical protein
MEVLEDSFKISPNDLSLGKARKDVATEKYEAVVPNKVRLLPSPPFSFLSFCS